ncbi:glutathione S-transferase family protein [Haliangium ochraceum]|uniref:Glutathione S-transferase domain protein n=1 Tax=Haliangium ochraceum (strain DSM 14365 / JCM 11303 / SMP-2) TaxID=502025 RepID=D0LTG2_HALO1|nr:glutathione S-transferase family protein [Haliangium ochraceum]ACY13857.1 Glutathione S-transferase domain protein [Haliangium ochraceum DSM 14365]
MKSTPTTRLYAWRTPNCHKVLILAEELNLAYEIVPVNIREGAQNSAEYRQRNANGKVPVLEVEQPGGEPLIIAESAAILIYLAEQSGRFFAPEGPQRYSALQWLMFQMSSVGSMGSQAVHFLRLEEKIPYAIDRYKREVERLYKVMDQRLGESEYFAGAYSIADMAMYPWVRGPEHFELSVDDFPNFKRWLASMSARPAVERAMATEFTTQ